jgi:hypothetical protein
MSKYIYIYCDNKIIFEMLTYVYEEKYKTLNSDLLISYYSFIIIHYSLLITFIINY